MADMMEFPNTWEEFEKVYGFADTKQIYTNGSRLIPSFRVEQWLDHITGEWNCAACEHFRSDTEEATEKCIYCHEGSNFQCVKTKGEE